MLPEKIFALWWTCDYAGDVPGDCLVAASIDSDSPAFERAGEQTYDGLTMSSRGSFVVREHEKPASITTLENKCGERVVFGETKAGEPGCWIDGNPHRLDDDCVYPKWTWNRAEREYLSALIKAGVI